MSQRFIKQPRNQVALLKFPIHLCHSGSVYLTVLLTQWNTRALIDLLIPCHLCLSFRHRYVAFVTGTFWLGYNECYINSFLHCIPRNDNSAGSLAALSSRSDLSLQTKSIISRVGHVERSGYKKILIPD